MQHTTYKFELRELETLRRYWVSSMCALESSQKNAGRVDMHLASGASAIAASVNTITESVVP